MIYKRPLRFTTLHFEQRVRIEDETFIITFLPHYPAYTAKFFIIPVLPAFV